MLSRTSTIANNKTPLGDEFPLLPINHVVNENSSDALAPATTIALWTPKTLEQTYKNQHANHSFLSNLSTRKKGAFCPTATAQVGTANCEYSINYDVPLLRQSNFDVAIQIVVPPPLRQCTLMVSHHRPIVKHPDQQRMYDTICCSIYWPHIAADVNHNVSTCLSCTRKNHVYRHWH